MSPPLEEIARLDDPAFWAGDPYPALARLRREAPVFWYEPGQFWAVTRYEDVRYVSQHSELFTSTKGLLMGENINPEINGGKLPEGAESLLQSDPPRQTQLRRLINRAFTPKRMEDMEAAVRKSTLAALDDITPGETINAVDALAWRVTLDVIADLLGVSEGDRKDFAAWSDSIVTTIDPSNEEEVLHHTVLRMQLWSYFAVAANDRLQSGETADLIGALVAAELDGERLSIETAVAFCILLLAAGNETTRNLIAGSLKLLAGRPDQRALLLADRGRLPVATEELLRYVSPVIYFARTATAPVELRGQQIHAGDYVVMFYASANRDETIWDRPEDLDVTRPVDPMHLAFGSGPHLCLGLHLARLEARVVFEEVLSRFPSWQLAGEPERVNTCFANAYSSLPLRFNQREPAAPPAADR